jgi:hypothetical protein
MDRSQSCRLPGDGMMYIHGYGAFVGPPVADIKEIKAEVSRHFEIHFRRANRFVLICLAGVCHCVEGHVLPKNTAVFLTTENGNLGDTETVLQQIYHKHEFPMPYNFINTMSNTASFYVSQSLGLLGRNITFSSKLLSFERGLELLRCDLLSGTIDTALLGGADEACFSRQQFEAKFARPYAAYNMVEGSGWLLIKSARDGAHGHIRHLESFDRLEETVKWIAGQSFEQPTCLAFGMLPDTGTRRAIAEILPDATPFDYIAEQGYFDSATACGVVAFMQRSGPGCLVHVNQDSRGQFVIMVVQKFR